MIRQFGSSRRSHILTWDWHMQQISDTGSFRSSCSHMLSKEGSDQISDIYGVAVPGSAGSQGGAKGRKRALRLFAVLQLCKIKVRMDYPRLSGIGGKKIFKTWKLLSRKIAPLPSQNICFWSSILLARPPPQRVSPTQLSSHRRLSKSVVLYSGACWRLSRNFFAVTPGFPLKVSRTSPVLIQLRSHDNGNILETFLHSIISDISLSN